MAALTDEQFDELTARLRSVQVTDLRPLAGGASSVTLEGRLGARRVVVKVAPPGVAPTSNRDVLRQARILRAMGPSEVPVPEVLIEDPGAPPDVPPFFVMSFLDGTSVEPLFDRHPERDAAVAERFRGAARVMARLHRLDPPSLGLAGEPVLGPDHEVERWCRLLETVDPTLVPGWRHVGAALSGSVPAAMAPAVVHGDFRLGNLLAAGDRITAVVDWEIWTVGDPRVDLGWFLINADPLTYRRRTPFAGWTPPPAELAGGYAGERGGPVPSLDWFQALACFKSAATWSLIVKHNRRRPTPEPDVEEMAAILPSLLKRTEVHLAANGD